MTRPSARSVPLQNRVTPFGEIVAVPERGTMMGNRGILHDAHQSPAPALGRAGLDLLPAGVSRPTRPGHGARPLHPPLLPGRADRAGGRPSSLRLLPTRRRTRRFATPGPPATRSTGPGRRRAPPRSIGVLHTERLGSGGDKRLHPTELAGLPDGTFVTPYPTGHQPEGPVRAALDGEVWLLPAETTDQPTPNVSALLVWQGRLWQWSPDGYQPANPIHSDPVLLLTPPSIVAALAAAIGPSRGLQAVLAGQCALGRRV